MKTMAYRTAARLLLIPMLLLFLPAFFGIIADRSVRGMSSIAQRWHKVADRAAAQGPAGQAMSASRPDDKGEKNHG